MEAIELTPEEIAAFKERQQMAYQAAMGQLEAKLDAWLLATKPLHDRWIQDLRQYDGKERDWRTKTDSGSQNTADKPPRLRATRSKTDLIEARQIDMLLPATMPQWRLDEEPEQDPETLAEIAAQIGSDDPAAITAEIKRRVKKLEKKVNDILTESKIREVSVKVIRDSGRVGTGLFVGPVNKVKRKERFRKIATEDGAAVEIEVKEMTYPAVKEGDIWRFIPEPVNDLDQATGAFYAELWTEHQVRELMALPYASETGITDLLQMQPQHGRYGTMVKERHTALGFEESLEGRYLVWRYTGAMLRREWDALCICSTESGMDPMPMVDMYFSQGQVLAARFFPLKGCWRIPYRIHVPNPDTEGWAGLSVPYLCRDSARMAQAAHEVALYNASVSAGGLIFHKGDLTPTDGKARVAGPKFFRVDKNFDGSANDAVKEVLLDNNVEQAMALRDSALSMMDEDLNLPQFTNPEVNKPMQTASGLAMWMNAQTVAQRRYAASFDACMKGLVDDIIRWIKLYDEDPDYRVDVQVVPLGQTELLVKDVQIQNLLAVMSMAETPVGQELDTEVIAKAIAQKWELPDDALLTPEKKQERQKNQPPDPKMAELELKKAQLQAETENQQRDDDFRAQDRMLDHKERMRELDIREQENQGKLLIAQTQMEIKAAELAQAQNLSLAQVQAQMNIAQMRQETEQYKTAFKGRIDAAKVQSAQAEMNLKLDPANPTNTGI